MMSQDQDGRETTRFTSRRRFATWVAGVLGLLLAGSVRALGLSRTKEALPTTKDLTLGVKHPTPRYIPRGFRHYYTYRNRPDGFRAGEAEIALWYRNPKLRHGHSEPLAIFIAPGGLREFALVGGRQPQEFPVVLANGTTVTAAYYDGAWERAPNSEIGPGTASRRWNTERMHSIVFALGSFMIGIRAGRRSGISMEHLLAVAASF